jgi:hypothetical protein
MSFLLPTKVGSLRVEGVNPEYDDTKWIVVPNKEAKELRWWQPDAFDTLKDARFGFAIAFCGSGKSILQVALAVHDVIQSGWTQKQLIVVPQSHISRGFIGDEDLDYIPILVDGEKYEWKVSHNFCDAKSQEVLANLKAWLLTSGEKLSRKFRGKIVSGLNAVASHQAIGLVWSKLTDAEKAKAINNLTFRPDEAHHIKGVFDQDEDELTDGQKLAIEMESNNLGDICRYIINCKDKTSKLHLTTATPHRGDKGIILSPAVQKMFTVYFLDWLDHWKTLGIHSFVVEYEEYDGDPIEQVVAKIKSEPAEKHMVVVPSTTHKWRPLGQHEYDRLLKRLSEEVPAMRVLDLVTQGTQAKNKALLLKEPKTAASGKSNFDIIITCMLGREGTDWCPCSRVHNTACENSIPLAIQTIGRPFRRFTGKTKVLIYYYVHRFAEPKKGLTKRALLSDRTNALLLIMQIDEMVHPIFVPNIPNGVEPDEDGDEDGHSEKPQSLAELFGERYLDMKQDLFEEVEALEDKTPEALDSIIEAIMDDYGIEDNRDGVKDALRVLILRVLSPQLKDFGIDVKFMRENGFDKIVEKYNLAQSSIYFGGDFGSSEWQTVREIYQDHWDEMYEEYKNRFGGVAA